MGLSFKILVCVLLIIILYHSAGSYNVVTKIKTKVDSSDIIVYDDHTAVLEFRLIMASNRVGNFLAMYFESLACAMQTGVDFRAVENTAGSSKAQRVDKNIVEHNKDTGMSRFVSFIPLNLQNNNATLTSEIKGKTTSEFIKNINRELHHCQCDKFCFKTIDGVSWFKQITTITATFLRALSEALKVEAGLDKIDADTVRGILIAPPARQTHPPTLKTGYVYNFGAWSSIMQSNNNTAITPPISESDRNGNPSNKRPYPLIPNVTIQIRCSDMLYCYPNLGCAKPGIGYGILPFSAYLTLIPNETASVYILSDSPNRANQGRDCGKVLEELVGFLSQHFPNADIYLKRGGSIFLTMVQLAYSPITICSASTFCFWPALASSTKVYFPRTHTITNGTMPQLTPAWNWIVEPRILQGDGTKKETVETLISRLKQPWDVITAPYWNL